MINLALTAYFIINAFLAGRKYGDRFANADMAHKFGLAANIGGVLLFGLLMRFIGWPRPGSTEENGKVQDEVGGSDMLPR